MGAAACAGRAVAAVLAGAGRLVGRAGPPGLGAGGGPAAVGPFPGGCLAEDFPASPAAHVGRVVERWSAPGSQVISPVRLSAHRLAGTAGSRARSLRQVLHPTAASLHLVQAGPTSNWPGIAMSGSSPASFWACRASAAAAIIACAQLKA